MLPGGGGYGEAGRRDAAALARDVADGFVTPAGAKRDYGIAIGTDGD